MHSTLVNFHFGMISGKLRNPGEAGDVGQADTCIKVPDSYNLSRYCKAIHRCLLMLKIQNTAE